MDPETKQLLEENLKLARENNELLRRLFKAERTRNITRYVYWAIIILFTVGSFWFLKPLLGGALGVYTGGTANTSGNSSEQMLDLLNSLKK
jgi:hypothetical protein